MNFGESKAANVYIKECFWPEGRDCLEDTRAVNGREGDFRSEADATTWEVVDVRRRESYSGVVARLVPERCLLSTQTTFATSQCSAMARMQYCNGSLRVIAQLVRASLPIVTLRMRFSSEQKMR